jgi:hypothetical protein
MQDDDEIRFTIPMPGGKVARVPVSVLQKYIIEGASPVHSGEGKAPNGAAEATSGTTTIRTGDGMITINIYANRGEVAIEHKQGDADDDVTAHSLSIDQTTGTSHWHTEWELGQCEYTDESGFPRAAYAWHRHPFGTEYTEIYTG